MLNSCLRNSLSLPPDAFPLTLANSVADLSLTVKNGAPRPPGFVIRIYRQCAVQTACHWPPSSAKTCPYVAVFPSDRAGLGEHSPEGGSPTLRLRSISPARKDRQSLVCETQPASYTGSPTLSAESRDIPSHRKLDALVAGSEWNATMWRGNGPRLR